MYNEKASIFIAMLHFAKFLLETVQMIHRAILKTN